MINNSGELNRRTPLWRIIAGARSILAPPLIRRPSRSTAPAANPHFREAQTLRERNRELERLLADRTAELEMTRAEARAAERIRSVFLADMSHRIRTPMTSILGFTDLLLDDSISSADRTQFVETIRKNGGHLLSIVSDIIDLSRLEAGTMFIERASCDPRRIVMDVVSTHRSEAAEQDVELHVEFLGRLPEATQTDAIRLNQILSNILRNAMRFTDRGIITIRIMLEGVGKRRRLRFDIEHPHTAMTTDEINATFEPFHDQGEPATARRQGTTGLGLSISRQLARLLGGDLTIAGGAAGSRTFTIRIDPGPLHESSTSADAPATHLLDPAIDSRLGEALPQLSGRILVACGGRESRRLLGFHLRRAGAIVEFAAGGAEVVDRVAMAESTSRPFDLILLGDARTAPRGCETRDQLRLSGCQRPVLALYSDAEPTPGEAECDAAASDPLNVRDLLTQCANLLTPGVSRPA